MGRPRDTCKTVFGTVAIKRPRLMQKADGSSEIPAARGWPPPPPVCITRGLKAAVIDLITKASVSHTIKQLARRAAEQQLLSHGTILNILHPEGARLEAAREPRARARFKQAPPAQPQ